jgi:hypothetical protein
MGMRVTPCKLGRAPSLCEAVDVSLIMSKPSGQVLKSHPFCVYAAPGEQ